MSAANATDDNRNAAPAATKNLTLRMGFVLLSGEAAAETPHQKLTGGRWHQILKRRLTLIFKVVNPLRMIRRSVSGSADKIMRHLYFWSAIGRKPESTFSERAPRFLRAP